MKKNVNKFIALFFFVFVIAATKFSSFVKDFSNQVAGGDNGKIAVAGNDISIAYCSLFDQDDSWTISQEKNGGSVLFSGCDGLF